MSPVVLAGFCSWATDGLSTRHRLTAVFSLLALWSVPGCFPQRSRWCQIGKKISNIYVYILYIALHLWKLCLYKKSTIYLLIAPLRILWTLFYKWVFYCGLLWVVCRVVIHRQFWRLNRSIPVAVDQEDFHTTEINCNWLINEGVWIDGFPRILTPWQSKIIDWRLPSFICPTRVKAELFKAAPTDRLHWSGSWVETEIQSNKP